MGDVERLLLVREYAPLRASPESCSWLATAAAKWGGCTPCMEVDGGKVFISSCDGMVEQPIEFCPGCGRRIEVQEALGSQVPE